ncbi:MAG TPA: putative lipid II flippase FtsW [Acidobacteriota bacterium]|nr:putative lipid II flippase FtsW [Acidobacteriota bacterium]
MAYKPSSDKVLFITTSFLTIFGLVMVYSASSVVAASQHGMSGYYFLRQLAFAGAGYVLLILLMNVDYHFWQRNKIVLVLGVLCVAALVLVLTQSKVNGAHRWLRYGSIISFQPSEIAKLVVLLFMAVYLHKHEAEINLPAKRLMPCVAVVLGIAGLIGVEPDLGQAVCVVLIACALLFIAGVSWTYIAGAFLLLGPAFYFFVMRVHFRWDRIRSFLDPGQDPLGAGWQILQSLTAIGSGGFWGAGLGASKQKLYFLPEAHSDFIFAVIGEELGLLGTTLIVVGFLIFFIRGMRITMKAPDRFGFYLGLGITLMVVLQAFINISMVLALMPTKGIALPFISQGGSSLLLNLMATGVLLNISHYGERA